MGVENIFDGVESKTVDRATFSLHKQLENPGGVKVQVF